MNPRRLLVCFAAAVNVVLFVAIFHDAFISSADRPEAERTRLFIFGFTTLLSATALLLTNEVKAPAKLSGENHMPPGLN